MKSRVKPITIKRFHDHEIIIMNNQIGSYICLQQHCSVLCMVQTHTVTSVKNKQANKGVWLTYLVLVAVLIRADSGSLLEPFAEVLLTFPCQTPTPPQLHRQRGEKKIDGRANNGPH